MRHRCKGFKLGRDSSHRKALAISLSKALIEHGRIKTTVPKAKFVKPIFEKLVTKAKNSSDNVTSIRYICAFLRDEKATKKILSEISPKYKDRPGGYLRIIRIGNRKGDDAEMALLELV